MEQLESRIASLETKIDTLQKSVQKLYNAFIWTLVITVALFILPLVGVLLLLPQFISTYTGMLGSI